MPDFVTKGYVGKLDAMTDLKLMFLTLAHRRNVSPMSFALMMAIHWKLSQYPFSSVYIINSVDDSHLVYNFSIDAASQLL